MAKKKEIEPTKVEPLQSIVEIVNLIVDVRGKQTMLDRDLAILYGVETKVLNQAVKRNIDRFPRHFRFQLTSEETAELVTNCDRLRSLKHSSVNPYVFTEQGVAMLSTVLHSETAVEVSIQIIDAFVAMRHFIGSNAQIFQRMEVMERNQLALNAHIEEYQAEADKKFDEVFRRLEDGSIKPTQGIFYDNQMFDAFKFVVEKVKEAHISIILFDNYIDANVLTILDNRNEGVTAKVYTRRIDPKLQLAVERHNRQFPNIDVEVFDRSHDRFLCIDETVYFIGASLKDLGKRWFAFAKMEYLTTKDLLERI